MATKYLVNITGVVTIDGVDTQYWSDTSGGAGGDTAPVAGDDIVVDGSSGTGTFRPNYNMSYKSLTLTGFGGTADFDFNTVSPTFQTVVKGGTTAMTLKRGTGTWTLTGTGSVWDMSSATGLTMPATTSGEIIINDASVTTKLFKGGGFTYFDLIFKGAGAGKLQITGSNTFNNFILQNAVKIVEFTAGTTQTVANLTVSGVSGSLNILRSVTADSTWAIVSTGKTITANYISLRDSVASGAVFYAGKDSTSVSGNSGWTFETAPNTYPRYECQELLNQLAGTKSLSQKDAINVLAGTTNLPARDAWNIYAGTTNLSIRAAANAKAGTTLLTIQDALHKIAGIGI